MISFVPLCFILNVAVRAQTPTPTSSAARPVPGPIPHPVARDSTMPHEGTAVCGSQFIKLNEFTCLEGRIACRLPKTKLCVNACYDPTQYECDGGYLIHGAFKRDISQPSEQHKAENHYKVAVPGPGAYGQLLHDLSRDGIRTTHIEMIRIELNKNGIGLTSPQVAVLLRDSMGSQAGLRQFEKTLTTEEKRDLDKAMPQVKAVLAAAVAGKATQGTSSALTKPSNRTAGKISESPTKSVPPAGPGTGTTTGSTTNSMTGATTGEVVPSSNHSHALSLDRSIVLALGLVLVVVASL